MKSISSYINEALKLGKIRYKYHPKTKKELKTIIMQRIKDEGNEVDLNDIDVSNITDMAELFYKTDFNGDISNWDVSNVIDMEFMFYGCTSFNQPLNNWDVSKVTDMAYMFYDCGSFNQDISNWDVYNAKYNSNIFNNCIIEEKHKPKFK